MFDADAVDLALVAVEAHREVPAVVASTQKSRVEPALQLVGARAQRRRERRGRRPRSRSAQRATSAAYTYPCTSHSAIGGRRERAVGEAHRVPGVLPTLVLQPAIGRALVLDVAVAVAVAVAR